MRYGIFSDIHSNLEALQAVLAKLETENVSRYICLGDIVGYGANPRECLRLVLERESLIVAGNHDYATAQKLSIDFFSQYAKDAVTWTRQQLTKEEQRFLSNLDLVQHIDNRLTIVHASLNFPELFDYIQTSYDAYISLEMLDTPVCFFGHSHVPVSFFQRQTISFSMENEIYIDKRKKTLVNVGSVGQPRDENPHASCAVYDDDVNIVWLHRVPYDVNTAKSKIIEAGLPHILGERLVHGR